MRCLLQYLLLPLFLRYEHLHALVTRNLVVVAGKLAQKSRGLGLTSQPVTLANLFRCNSARSLCLSRQRLLRKENISISVVPSLLLRNRYAAAAAAARDL